MQQAFHDRWGGPEVVGLREVEVPVPIGDEVLVRVHASSVNRADLDWLLPKLGWFARLLLGVRRPRRQTIGIDVAGTVEASGPAVTRFKPGDRVYGDLIFRPMAAFAEYACVTQRRLHAIPDGLSFEEAATIPHSAALAVMALKPYWGHELHSGDSLLVVGASGNVGPFLVQMAKARGLRVAGVCRTSKMDFVRSLGADEVIDYTSTDYTRTGPYDRIVDVDGHRSIFGFRRALKPGGIYISMGGNGVWILSYFAAALTFQLRRGGRQLGLMPGWRPLHAEEAAADARLLADGAFRPRIDRTYPLAQVREALADVHEGRNRGKVVITMG